METSKFDDFTIFHYEDIYKKLANEEIDIWADVRDGADVDVADLPLSIVSVTEFK